MLIYFLIIPRSGMGCLIYVDVCFDLMLVILKIIKIQNLPGLGVPIPTTKVPMAVTGTIHATHDRRGINK